MPELIPPSEDAGLPPSRTSQAPENVDGYVRRKLWGALLSILTLLAIVAFLSIRHREALGEITTWVFDHVGLSGLVALLFVSDAVFSPVPPDAVLVLISQSSYHESWHMLVPVLGLLSTVAGWVGYFCGRRLANTALTTLLFRRFKQTGTAVIHRYGPWGVVLGALTPMPFSLTCWTAGMLEIPFRRLVWPCLLRVPRFVVYYLAIAHAESLVRLVF